jgi:hypothetical protein
LAALPSRRCVHLTDEDLELGEWACRGPANQYREGAKKHSNPTIRDGFEERAARMERLAERLKRFRNAGRTAGQLL